MPIILLPILLHTSYQLIFFTFSGQRQYSFDFACFVGDIRTTSRDYMLAALSYFKTGEKNN